jgi:succinate-semialdehyde dehydrogenase/glutarate-semialdehyde dehydrogenase
LLIDAGAPEGLYTNLLVSHQQSNQIIDDPRRWSSVAVMPLSCLMTLTSTTLYPGLFGGVCTTRDKPAAKRFIVLDSIADKFIEKFQTALELQQPGEPMDEKTTKGPMSQEAAMVNILKQVDDAVAHGARVLMGGKRIDCPGSFMQTTILTNIAPCNLLIALSS